jgi:hypothetical protein
MKTKTLIAMILACLATMLYGWEYDDDDWYDNGNVVEMPPFIVTPDPEPQWPPIVIIIGVDPPNTQPPSGQNPGNEGGGDSGGVGVAAEREANMPMLPGKEADAVCLQVRLTCWIQTKGFQLLN